MKGTPSPRRIAVDVWQAQNASQQGLARRRKQRLTDLVAFARARSAFYRRHYSGLPDGPVALESLPPVSKPRLMAAFDDWITDPALGRGGVEAILSKATATGVAYHDGLFVCTSSGTTGQPGIFVHDAGAVDVYRVLNAIRLGCAQGWIHVNSDWAILELVDENFRPTSPGAGRVSKAVEIPWRRSPGM